MNILFQKKCIQKLNKINIVNTQIKKLKPIKKDV